MTKFFKYIYILILFFFLQNSVPGQTPKLSIQGTLKDAKGAAAGDGIHMVTFRLYNAPISGSVLWTEVANVEVSGGIYSHYLGSITPLNNNNFANTLYLGVQVGSIELSPRTELTYAPYAFAVQEVFCSGAVGDVKYSILDPVTFLLANGDCWVPMDGRSIVNSKLATYLGANNVPDGSGLFLRIQEFNNFNNYDPTRTSATPIGTLQSSDVKAHNHNVSETPHSHQYNDIRNDVGIAYTYIGAGQTDHPAGDDVVSDVTENTNSATMNASINNSGVSESRPKNLNFWIYVRIN